MELIRGIFQNSGYELLKSEGEIFLYTKPSEEYYFLSSYAPSEAADFFKHPKTQAAYELIEGYKASLPDIAKNTSMIILIDVENLSEGLAQLRNSVYAIEEDPYIFRKYVIFSTKKAIKGLEGKSVEDIISYAAESENFQQYQNFQTRYTNESYCLAIQLLIKLPFLQLPPVSTQLDDLRAQLSAAIGEKGQLIIERLRDKRLEENDDIRTQALIPSSDNEFDKWLDESLENLGTQK